MTGWHEKTLGDVLTLQRGFDITKAQQSNGPYPVVSSSGINSFHCEYTCDAPGVVIGRKGSLGSAFFLNTPFWAHDTTLWVKDFKHNHPKFCFYLLKALPLAHYDVGSSNPTLNRNHLHLLKIRIPEPNEQRRIASILSAYDDLIEVNTRRIAVLDEMARRLFDEWFGGKGLSPARFQKGRLRDIVKDIRDPVLPSDIPPETPYVGLEHMSRRSTTLVDWGRAGEVASTKLRFCAGDILFGKIRPYFHKVVIAAFAGVSSSDAIVMRPRQKKWTALALYLVSSDAFIAHAVQTSNGTKMPRAKADVLMDYPVLIPPDAELRKFSAVVEPAISFGSNLADANVKLGASRDLLLPKLISGEIDVSSAEREVARAAKRAAAE